MARSVTYKIDLGFGYARNSSAEPKDNLIRKLVGDDASCIVGGNIAVLLANHQRRSSVFDVVQPALHRELARGHAEVAESQHGGIRRRRIPQSKSHFRRLSGNLQWVKAF